MIPRNTEYMKPAIPKGPAIVFRPQGYAAEASATFSGMFDLSEFLHPGAPQEIERCVIPRAHWNILRMPIKRPCSDYRIPMALSSLEPIVRLVADAEAKISADHDRAHCHITLERQFVLSGETQRMPGFHVDGFQRLKHGHYTEVEHSYIVSDVYPTEFSIRGYDLSWVENWRHMFRVMDAEVPISSVVVAEPNKIYRMTCYQVHRTPRLPRNTWRSFLRVTYAMRELEDPRNTVNPCFDGQVYGSWSGDIRNILV